MANYYIDYENVHNEGLKGIEKLGPADKLSLFYSNKADTLKIDIVCQLLECQASISFHKIVNGIENALDFQLITALMCNYTPDADYYIISRDKGYDAAIDMACRQDRENIYRCRDIEGALKHQSGLGIDESDQEVIVDLDLDAPGSGLLGEVYEVDMEEMLPADKAEAEYYIPHVEAQQPEAQDEVITEEVPEIAAVEAESETAEDVAEEAVAVVEPAPEAEVQPEPQEKQEKPKRRRGRPSKKDAAKEAREEQKVQPENADQPEAEAEEAVKAKPDSRKKSRKAKEKHQAEQEEQPVVTEEAAKAEEEPQVEGNQTEVHQAEAHQAETRQPGQVDEEELQRRAYQSICTKIMNHIKLTHKIPLTYKQAGTIYEALSASENKMQFYHKLSGLMGRKDGGELYQKVKPAYKSIVSMYKAATGADDHKESTAEQVEQAQAPQDVESVKAAFEEAERNQGNPGEAIQQMVELVKDI